MNLKKIHGYLHTFCRYFLATTIISYAFAKILGTQFTSSPSTYDTPIESLNGLQLTWYYYGYSSWYGMLIAGVQIASAFFLFFRKTTRIGVVLFLSFMVNILLTDFVYHIDPPKKIATLLTGMALFVFFSEFPLLYKYFVTEPPLFQNKDRANWVNKISIIKWLYIPAIFIYSFYAVSSAKTKYMSTDQFYGTWKNADSTSVLHRLYFEEGNFFTINSYYDNENIAWGPYSFKNDTIAIQGFTKEYQNYLMSGEAKMEDFFHPDSTKMITILKGKYQFTDKRLIIQTDSSEIVFNRIR
jgi:hypothetical protein